MGLLVGVGAARLEENISAHALERLDHAFGRLAGGGEKFQRGVIGLVFLAAHIGEQLPADKLLRRRDARHADAAASASPGGDGCADARQ